ncbi:MAG: DsbA family protein [Hyphomicrobiaceae bacterium]|nr:DsbA family protein [Hyphomicrobiaceae bacterium]
MIRRLLLAATATLALGLAVLPAPTASAAALTDAQKDEVRALVKEFLLKNPEVIEEAMTELENKRSREQAEARAKAVGEQSGVLFNSTRQGEFGNPKGDVVVVEFFDYNCGFCKRAAPDMAAVLGADSGVRYVTKEFPVLGAGSVEAAKVSIAVKLVAPDKHFEFHKKLLQVRGEANKAKAMEVAADLGVDADKLDKALASPEVAATIEEVYAIANGLGLSGTPTYVIGQDVIPGAIGIDKLKEKIAEARKCGPDGKKC